MKNIQKIQWHYFFFQIGYGVHLRIGEMWFGVMSNAKANLIICFQGSANN